MSNLLPEDNIPASGEISYSPRLGLPKIPRSNNQALAAINAITRILDTVVLTKVGGVASGEYTFEGPVNLLDATIVSLSSLSQYSDYSNIISLVSALGKIDDLTADILAVGSGEITNLNSTSISADELVATLLSSNLADITTLNTILGTFSEIQVTTLAASIAVIAEIQVVTGVITTLNSTDIVTDTLTARTVEAETASFDSIEIKGSPLSVPQTRIGTITPNYSSLYPEPQKDDITFDPDVIDYTLTVKSPIESTITGTLDVSSGDSIYTLLGDRSYFLSETPTTGQSFPGVNQQELYNVQYAPASGEVHLNQGGDFHYNNQLDYEFTYKATRYPRS